MQMVSAIVASVLAVTAATPTLELLHQLQAGFTIWLAGSFAADVLIASSMMIIVRACIAIPQTPA